MIRMPILFTVQPSPRAGFTDQLTTLSLVYDIGTRCEYEFRLTPFATPRSGQGVEERYDLTRTFPVFSAEEANLPTVRVELSGASARNRGVRTPWDLVALVKEQVPADARVVVFDVVDRESLLRDIAWDAPPRMTSFHAGLGEALAPRHRWPSTGGLRTLVHLRCGDTADIPLIGRLNYRVRGGFIAIAQPSLPTPFLGARLAMDVVRERSGAARAEFRVFSDGYERTNRMTARSSGPGGTITPGLAKLLNKAIDLHAEAARGMIVGDDVTFSMDESLDSLGDLIDAAQEADLIIVTSAQRMIPKLLAALGPRDRLPGLLLLDPYMHHSMRRVRLDERHARLITLSAHGDALAPLRAFLDAAADPAGVRSVEPLAATLNAGTFCIPELEPVAVELETQGRHADARAVYEWLTVLTDGSPAALAGVSRCAERMGDHAAAEAAGRRAAEAIARCVAAYRPAILAATKRGLRDDASALFDEARRIVGPDVNLSALVPDDA